MCLTRNDCEKILSNSLGHSDFRLLQFTLKPYSEDLIGFQSEQQLLLVEFEENYVKKQLTFFVKVQATTGFSACFRNAGYFKTERRAYEFFEDVKRLVPKICWDVVPRMFYATEANSLVLENLINYKGVPSKMTEEHLLKAIEALAKFHTVTIAAEELTEVKPPNFEEPLFHHQTSHSGRKFINSCILGCLEAINLMELDVNDKFLKSVSQITSMLTTKTQVYRSVLCHGDLHSGNCLFNYDDSGKPMHCKIIDFQFLRYLPPAHDLTMLIYCSTNLEDLKKHLQKYYQHYYAVLTKELAKLSLNIDTILPLDEFQESCKDYMPSAKLIWLFYSISRGAEDFVSEDLAFYEKVLLGDKRGELVRQKFSKDKKFEQNIRELLEDYLKTLNM